MQFRRFVVAFTFLAVGVCLSFYIDPEDVSAVGAPVNGSGTSGRVAKFRGANCVEDSEIRESNSGNVGIGTNANPNARLLVAGTVAATANTNGSAGALIANQNGDGRIADFRKNASEVVVIDNGGNVGIGTTTPNSPLEVSGVVHSTSGGIMFPDGTLQTTAAVVGSPPPFTWDYVFIANPASGLNTIDNAGSGIVHLLHVEQLSVVTIEDGNGAIIARLGSGNGEARNESIELDVRYSNGLFINNIGSSSFNITVLFKED